MFKSASSISTQNQIYCLLEVSNHLSNIRMEAVIEGLPKQDILYDFINTVYLLGYVVVVCFGSG